MFFPYFFVIEARAVIAGLAVAAVFSWFFEQAALPGTIGALFAGALAGSTFRPFVAPLLFFTLGTLFSYRDIRKYLPVLALSVLPIIFAGAGLTALVLSFFIRDPLRLTLIALAAGASAPLFVSYVWRRTYRDVGRDAMVVAIYSMLSLFFVLASMGSPTIMHFPRAVLFFLAFILCLYLSERITPKSSEAILFMLSAGFLTGSALEGFLGNAAYFLGGVLASGVIHKCPRPLRKAILGGLTIVVFLGLGSWANVFNVVSLAVLILLLASRVVFHVVAERFLFPATFFGRDEAERAAHALLPLGAPFLYALAGNVHPAVFSGAFLGVAILQTFCFIVQEGNRIPHVFAQVAASRAWTRDAAAVFISLGIIYAIIPLSFYSYWMPFVVLIPFYMYVHFLRKLVRDMAGQGRGDVADAYVFGYALLLISLALFSVVSLVPSPIYLIAATGFALFSLFYMRYISKTVYPHFRNIY